jgi:hypothetical protein
MKRWLFHLGMGTLVAALVVAADRQFRTTVPIPFLIEVLVVAAAIAVVIWMRRSRLAEWLRQKPPVALAGFAILIGVLAPIITFEVMHTPPQCRSGCPSYAISGSTSHAQAAFLLGGWALSLTLLIWGVIAKIWQKSSRAPDRVGRPAPLT